MNWIVLFIAGLFEVVWATALKYSEGFTKLIPSAVTISCALVSFYLLAYAMRTLPLGTAYAVWTGVGVVGSVIFGICFLGESLSLLRLLCVLLIVSGIIGLKLLTPTS